MEGGGFKPLAPEIKVNANALASTAKIAPINAATRNSCVRASPLAARMLPMSAVAIRPPVRARALLKPEAEPVWRWSTELRTAVVRGATAPAMPMKMTRIAGSAVGAVSRTVTCLHLSAEEAVVS